MTNFDLLLCYDRTTDWVRKSFSWRAQQQPQWIYCLGWYVEVFGMIQTLRSVCKISKCAGPWDFERGYLQSENRCLEFWNAWYVMDTTMSSHFVVFVDVMDWFDELIHFVKVYAIVAKQQPFSHLKAVDSAQLIRYTTNRHFTTHYQRTNKLLCLVTQEQLQIFQHTVLHYSKRWSKSVGKRNRVLALYLSIVFLLLFYFDSVFTFLLFVLLTCVLSFRILKRFVQFSKKVRKCIFSWKIIVNFFKSIRIIIKFIYVNRSTQLLLKISLFKFLTLCRSWMSEGEKKTTIELW
jgi:hypothetical protein